MDMIYIECKIKGKKVNLKDVGKFLTDDFPKAILEEEINQLNIKTKSMECSVHPSEQVRITVSLVKDKINVEIDGCCDTFVDEVSKAIS